jgi:hypothetical protein
MCPKAVMRSNDASLEQTATFKGVMTYHLML